MDNSLKNDSVYNLLAHCVEEHKAKTAFNYYGGNISFKSFMEQVDAVAQNLSDMGVTPKSVVTVCMPNIPQNAIAFYAINRIGAVSDILHPLISLKAMKENMKRTDSSFLIASDNVLAKNTIAAKNIKVIYARISEYMPAAKKIAYEYTQKKYSFHPKENYIDFNALVNYKGSIAKPYTMSDMGGRTACYLHSGGTMGEPKTVAVSNAALNRTASKTDFYVSGIDLKGKCMYSVLPCFHGFGLSMNLHLGLLFGMKQIMVAKFDAKQAVRLIKKHRVNIINGVPTIFNALLKQEGFNRKSASSLIRCFVGGDSVPASLVDSFNIAVTGSEENHVLFCGYGLTETIAVCAVNTPEFYRENSCGKSVTNSRCEVIADGKIRERGTEGELCITSDAMMQYYLGDEAATASAIQEHDGKLWIHTGDWGTVDKDGYIFFKQRMKHIIIRKGENIFPSEIEAAINQLDFTEQCCVVGRTNPKSATQFVCAYVRTKDGCKNDAETVMKIKKQVELSVAKFAVPEKIVFVDSFPKTAIGKIDAKALN